MRVAVIGASGNVGTSVLRALAADDAVHEIVAIARRLPGPGADKTRWRSADITRAARRTATRLWHRHPAAGPRSSGPLRWKEFFSGVGARDG